MHGNKSSSSTPKPKGTQGKPPGRREISEAMGLAPNQFKEIYFAARSILPASALQRSHFELVTEQVLDTATHELRQRFEGPEWKEVYRNALAIEWAPREFFYRAWRTGRRTLSMISKRQFEEGNSESHRNHHHPPHELKLDSGEGHSGGGLGGSGGQPGPFSQGYRKRKGSIQEHLGPISVAKRNQGGKEDIGTSKEWLDVILLK